jgi:hypothetical protein
MKFSASKFRKDKRYRRLLPDSHLAVLDGREVVDEHINYEVDGEEFYLYPVIPEWCEVEK